LLEQLNADPQGVSYRAVDREAEDPIEIRILDTADELLWAATQRRCRLAELIDSPYVRHVRAMELAAVPPYIVLDPPAEFTLSSVLADGGPLEFARAVHVLHCITIPLIAAHRVGISHGRLRPAEIGWSGMLEDENSTCSLDFTRTPGQRESSLAVDIQQLSRLWTWLLGVARLESPSCPAELVELFESMARDEQSQGLTSIVVASTLAAWLRSREAESSKWSETIIGAHDPVSDPTTLHEAVSCVADTFAVGTTVGTAHSADVSDTAFPTDPLLNCRTLGRYRLLSKLGEGGMGTVWRAEDPVDGQHVAVKVLRSDLARNENVRRRFLREARVLTELKSPYIANMLDVNVDGELHYFVLEFVDGCNLMEYLKQKGRLEEREAVTIVSDVARALQEAHERGIVHRDLKPENVLLQGGVHGAAQPETAVPLPSRPRVKLTDFGLARHLDETESMNLTNAGAVLGTPLYFAPEQCSGKSDVDHRADLYSLGATLFRLLTGRPPFEANNIAGLIAKHVNEPAPRIRSVVPELSDALEGIVAKCLQKSPSARYQTAGELLNDLESLLSGKPTSIVAHPLVPAANAADVLTFDFTWELTNPPHLLWPHVTNTERLNKAIGLPAVEYTSEPDPVGGSRRFAKIRKLGMAVGWREHPFEWVEGRRMGVLREFHQGPWKWFTSIVELTPRSDGGTTLVHRVRMLPANLVGKLAASIEIGLKTRKALEKVYRHIDAAVSGDLGKMADPFEEADRLADDATRKLDHRLRLTAERGADLFALEQLGEFLAASPVQELSRIRPLALARRLDVDEQKFLEACLLGAREGLLTLLWDILCPVCRIPSQVKDSLRAIREHGHCEACQTDFELDFANSIEMIFRVAPDIRNAETGVYCIGGPAHSPHVAAQVRLAPGERFEMDLALATGGYRLRGPQLPYCVEFRVLPEASASRWELQLTQGPLPELPRQLKTGEQHFVFVNDTVHEVLARIERTVNRNDAMTAARAAATPLFRDLFAGECLAPEQLVQIEQVTLLFTRLSQAQDLYFEWGDAPAFRRIHEHFRQTGDIIRREGGSLFKTIGEGACAVFTDPVSAMRAAVAIQELDEPRLRVAIHRGPALVATINDHLDYFGATVSATNQLLDSIPPGELHTSPRVVVSHVIASDPDVIRAICGTPREKHFQPWPLVQSRALRSIYPHELV
jgi:serine/threonine protein kinase/class 3 adenylate cyclase